MRCGVCGRNGRRKRAAWLVQALCLGLLAGRPGVGTFVTASVGDVQPAIPLPLRRELTRWIAKARDAGLDDDSIEALFGDCFRAETAAGVA